MTTRWRVSYEPFLDLETRTLPALDDGYRRFQNRREKLGLREALAVMRSPEVAAALGTLVVVLRAQRGPARS